MKLDIESILPFVIGGFFIAAIYLNNSTPSETPNGFKIVKPKSEIELIRENDDVTENDNQVKISHIDRPNDVLSLRLWHDYILYPNEKDGTPAIPTRRNDDGTTTPIWKIEAVRKKYIFDPGWDIGAYAGYLSGPKGETDIKPLDVGIRFSPLRIWNTAATDILVSNQAAGLGISFYPAPERYGEGWSHVGIGYGRVISYSDECSRNLFYASFSTRF
jgi:hypothetical protein